MAKDDWLWPWPQIDDIRTEHWFVNHNVSQCANLKIDVLCITPMVEKSHIYCCYQYTVERNQSLSQCVTVCHNLSHVPPFWLIYCASRGPVLPVSKIDIQTQSISYLSQICQIRPAKHTLHTRWTSYWCNRYEMGSDRLQCIGLQEET